MAGRTLVLGTRRSALALWQARYVQERLEAAGHTVKLHEVVTKGDRILDKPLAEIGDKGLFTQELDTALLDGRIHLAVHSLKDLPTRLPEGLSIAAVSERAAPWDAFVAHPSFPEKIDELPEGATLATSSLRRQSQLLAWRPDLEVVPVRGNVGTRLEKLDASTWHGMILAAAGLERLELAHRIREALRPPRMIPAVSQGALGIVCAERDGATRAAVQAAVHHAPTAAAVTAERAFLRSLEGGCQAPIGAHAWLESGRLRLVGFVASVDGQLLVRGQHAGASDDAERLGTSLAERLMTEGAAPILNALRSAS